MPIRLQAIRVPNLLSGMLDPEVCDISNPFLPTELQGIVLRTRFCGFWRMENEVSARRNLQELAEVGRVNALQVGHSAFYFGKLGFSYQNPGQTARFA